MSSFDDYLPLSGIQHYAFCRRQWALIHVEQQWQDNRLTVEGRIQHETVHDESRTETRGDTVTIRGMRIVSHALKLQGACDAVEFHRDKNGVSLAGREGLWLPFPIEYKHGRAGGATPADSLQLCCQAICLEEMLLCSIPGGALFYQETRRREPVAFDQALRARAQSAADDMNAMFMRGHTPSVKQRPVCKSCSLRDLCLPQMLEKSSTADYIRQTLGEMDMT